MKTKLTIGILLMIFSYFSYLLPEKLLGTYPVFLLFLIFIIGMILICEVITMALKKKSLTKEIIKNKMNLVAFLIVSIIGALMIEMMANYSGKLWYYPKLNIYLYAILFVPLVTFYWLLIAESYLATKAVIDYLVKGKKIITAPLSIEGFIFKFMGMSGMILLAGTIGFALADYVWQGKPFFTPQDIYLVTNHYRINFSTIMLIFLGVWFTLEYLEYSRKKSSLMKDLLHGYFTPILAIIFGSLLTAILMETQNIPAQAWIYINWPFAYLRLFSLPLFVYLAWPLHYITFLSLFRFLTSRESEEIWRGDLIK